MTTKSRRTENLGQDRLITLIDKQDREIHDQDKIIERIESSTPSYTTVNIVPQTTDPMEVPEITSWEMEVALRDMKNGTPTGKDHVNIETLKAEDIISKTLAKLYTKCISERTLRW